MTTVPGRTGWVCLMYHDISRETPGVSGGREHYAVSARTFGEQLDAIRDAGRTGVPLETLLDEAAAGRVAITFDDGDAGQYAYGVPALADRGMAATFFVVTGWVGTPGYATWEQLGDMARAGMSIQAHTHTHPFLSELSAVRVRDELRRARDLIGEHLGAPATTIAFPGGDPPRGRWRDLLQELGYRAAATSRWGVNRTVPAGASVAVIRRCTVRGTPSAGTFRRMLEGDPWLAIRRRARDGVLRSTRRVLGPTRYARWRRAALNVFPS